MSVLLVCLCLVVVNAVHSNQPSRPKYTCQLVICTSFLVQVMQSHKHREKFNISLRAYFSQKSILSLFTHPYVVPNSYVFFLFVCLFFFFRPFIFIIAIILTKNHHKSGPYKLGYMSFVRETSHYSLTICAIGFMHSCTTSWT